MKGRDELRKKWKEGDEKNKTIQTVEKQKKKQEEERKESVKERQ